MIVIFLLNHLFHFSMIVCVCERVKERECVHSLILYYSIIFCGWGGDIVCCLVWGVFIIVIFLLNHFMFFASLEYIILSC